MSKKLLLVVTILVVGIGAIASFAVTQTSASASVTVGNGITTSFVNVTTSGVTKWETDASWIPIQHTAGGIDTKGDVYYFEPVTDTIEAMAFVYLTNVGELANNYSYLNMGFNLWYIPAGGGTDYTEVYTTTGEEQPDEWLTLSNGYVVFDIPGKADTTGDGILDTQVITYALTLDRTSWYCTDANTGDAVPAGSESLAPSFYVHVVQE